MSYELVTELAGTQSAFSVCLSDDGTVAVAAWSPAFGEDNGYVKVYVDGWDDPIQIDAPAGAVGFGFPAIVSGDGSTVFISGFGTGDEFSVWAYRGSDFSTRTEIQTTFPNEFTNSFACSRNGNVLAVASANYSGGGGDVLVRSGSSWATQDAIPGEGLAFGVTPDGSKVVMAPSDLFAPYYLPVVYSGANYSNATVLSVDPADFPRALVSRRGQVLAWNPTTGMHVLYQDGAWGETRQTAEWSTVWAIDPTGTALLFELDDGTYAVLDETGAAEEVRGPGGEPISDLSSEGEVVGIVNYHSVEIYEAGGGDGWGVLLS